MIDKPTVVEFKCEGWREAVNALRAIADRIEAGDLPRCEVGVFMMKDEDGGFTTCGMGTKGEDLALLGLVRCAEQILVRSALQSE